MSSPSGYESAYVPSVQFRDQIDAGAIDPYIEEKILQFLQVQEGISELDDVPRIAPEDAITDIEWAGKGKEKQVDFKYLYEVIMDGARKEDGEIDHIAYTLTFDRELTPNRCEETETHYGCMTLAGEPILYYVRLDLAELIAVARSHASHSEPT